MCVAVEREEAARRDCALGKRVVEVLSGRVAIDLDGDAFPCGEGEHRVPIGDDARARSGDATARMGEDVHRGIPNRGQQPAGLVLGPAKAGVRRRQHEFELRRFLRGEIQLTVGADIGLDASNQSKSGPVDRVERIDGAMLCRRLGHRHSACDRQPWSDR